MTKRVRVENACGSNFKVVVQVWDRGLAGEPDKLVREIPLNYPTALTPEDLNIWDTRYLVVKEY